MKRKWPIGLLIAAIALSIGLALASGIVWPAAIGTDVIRDGKLTVDWSEAPQGYFMAEAASGGKACKLRVKYGDTTMTYNIGDEYEIFPLQFGSGEYTISLYESTGSKKFASVGMVRLNVTIDDPNAPFLIPNQMVDYSRDTEAVAIAAELCLGKTNDREKFEAIRSYVLTTYTYDFVRTFSVTSDFLPDIDYCTGNRTGVYLDLAATTACMLRSQGVPVRFVMGHLDKNDHAWNIVLLDGQEVLYDPSVEIGGVLGTNYTTERIY